MECKDYREQFTSLLTDSIPQAQRSEIESHLEGCANCREEFESAQKIWYLMGEMTQPEPSATMQSDFNAILSEFKKEQKIQKNLLDEWMNKLREFLYLQVQPRLAYSLLLVALAWLQDIFYINPDNRQSLTTNRLIRLRHRFQK